MTVNATNNEKSSSLLPLATTLTGGLIGGFAIGNKQTINFDPEKVLQSDKFEVTGKLADALTEDLKKAVTDINTNLQTIKNAKSFAEDEAKNLFKDKQEISVPEFLSGKINEEPPKRGFFSRLFGRKQPKEEITTEKSLENFGRNIEEQNKNLAGIQKSIEEAPKDMAEEAKKGLQESFNKIKAEIDEATAKLDFAKSAKDGKITKAAFAENAAKTIETEASGAMAKSFKILENAYKKSSSFGRGVFGCAVGYISGLIIEKLLKTKQMQKKES